MNRGEIVKTGRTREILSDKEVLGKARLLPPQIAQTCLLLGNEYKNVFTVDEMIKRMKEIKGNKGE